MNDYIKDLTSRMADGNYAEGEVKIKGEYESHKTVSAKAHNEARGLSNTELIAGLFADIALERDHNKKRDLYFILKHIAINTQNIKATAFLLERLELERDRYVLVTMLSGLAEIYKSEELDLTPIFKCADSKNRHVSGKAYEALTNSPYNVEAFLLERLKVAENSDDIRYLITALKYVATESAVPSIEHYLKHKQTAVANAAAYTLAIVMVRADVPLDDIHEKVGISVERLNELAVNLPALTRAPLKTIL